MEALKIINTVIGIAFFVCYSYQIFYLIVGLLERPRKMPDAVPLHYGIIIAARNEENVIENLIASIRAQKYPQELLDIFVIADNCTDRTADVARAAGAKVYERQNHQQVGKGYALQHLFSELYASGEADACEGFFFFDADNLLAENYISEMNKTFSQGWRIVTSYRNSTNYGDSWISAGNALWYLRDAKYLNNSRMILGTSSAVTGTGFLVHRDVLRKNGGWKHFLLTEDCEFTVDSILHGEEIGFCGTAEFFDEQTSTFRQSWNQRLRWSKGYFQVFARYGGSLIRGAMRRGGFACFDMVMSIMPAFLLTVVAIIVNLGTAIASFAMHDIRFVELLLSMGQLLVNVSGFVFILGAVTLITEWKHIHCGTGRKLWSLVTFPFFMLTYIPISVAALFMRVEWKPIRHAGRKSVRS